MRNQIEAAERMGVRAATINSANTSDWDDVVARINADGGLDTGFADMGAVRPANTSLLTVAIQPDRKILVGGVQSANGVSSSLLARFNADGTPDTTFDADGQTTLHEKIKRYNIYLETVIYFKDDSAACVNAHCKSLRES